MFGKIALAHNDLATTAHGTATTNRININAKASGGLQNRLFLRLPAPDDLMG
jgi:hypothetical protein